MKNFSTTRLIVANDQSLFARILNSICASSFADVFVDSWL